MLQRISKIKWSFVLAFAISAPLVHALEVGGMKLGVGPKISLNMNKADIGAVGDSSFGYSWGIGATSVLDLDPVAIELGLQYSERRFDFSNLGGLSGDFAATLKQIEVPLLAYYKHTLSEVLALRAGAGAQFDFGVGDVKGDAGSVSYSDAGINKFGTSALLDFGVDYVLADLGTLAVDLRYAMGLSDRSESSGMVFADKFKTQYIELGAALLF